MNPSTGVPMQVHSTSTLRNRTLENDYYVRRAQEAVERRQKTPREVADQARREGIAADLRAGIKRKDIYKKWHIAYYALQQIEGDMDLGKLGGWGRPS